MKYLYLVWSNLKRKKMRTALTLLSIMIAFLLFGYLGAIRQAFSQGIDVAGLDLPGGETGDGAVAVGVGDDGIALGVEASGVDLGLDDVAVAVEQPRRHLAEWRGLVDLEADRVGDVLAGHHEQRQHEHGRVQPRLGDHPAEARRRPQTARPDNWEHAHGELLSLE